MSYLDSPFEDFEQDDAYIYTKIMTIPSLMMNMKMDTLKKITSKTNI